MSVISTTRPHECLACRKPTIVKEETKKEGLLTIISVCQQCKLEYHVEFATK